MKNLNHFLLRSRFERSRRIVTGATPALQIEVGTAEKKFSWCERRQDQRVRNSCRFLIVFWNHYLTISVSFAFFVQDMHDVGVPFFAQDFQWELRDVFRELMTLKVIRALKGEQRRAFEGSVVDFDDPRNWINQKKHFSGFVEKSSNCCIFC